MKKHTAFQKGKAKPQIAAYFETRPHRVFKIMDGYMHLYIDNLRPYVVMLDEEVKAARQV